LKCPCSSENISVLCATSPERSQVLQPFQSFSLRRLLQPRNGRPEAWSRYVEPCSITLPLVKKLQGQPPSHEECRVPPVATAC
jgi:hypothetical protein